MLEHLDKHLHVAKLASLVNISPSHFFALFKRRTGCAPIDFFIRLRMQHACQLLDETSLNVKEIAAVLGYDDPFYFSRTFKAVNEVSPSDYRMMSLKMKDAVRNATWPSTFLWETERNAGFARGLAAPTPEQRASATATRTTAGSVVEWMKDGASLRVEEDFCHTKGNTPHASRS
jgi:AraC-like DNA-binding protein